MPEFVPTDGPELDETISQLPTDILRDLAEQGKNDLFFFDHGVLGYKDMTVSCHGPLCSFIQNNPSQFKRVLMPRDHFKSTCITIGGNLQKVVRNPDECIHIKNENALKASRFLSAIQTHATTNKIFRTLYSQFVPPDVRKVRWNAEEADFVGRSGVYPEPTISISGMTSATVGAHFSHIVFDDPISRDAVQSPPLMLEAIERMKDATSLLRKPLTDTIWLVGTRWAYHDVYSWWDSVYSQLTGKFSRAAIEDGKPIFPELISLDFLDMKRREDEYLFSCNYMNSPRNATLQDMDVSALKVWAWSSPKEDAVAIFDPRSEMGLVRVIPLEQLEITVTVDLAPAETITSDRNVVFVLGVDPASGYSVVLEIVAERCTPLQLIDHLIRINQRWHPWKVGIEGVAYQKAFKYFLKNECDDRGIYMNIVELRAVGKKELRIKGLQPLIKVGRIAVHPTQQILKNELSEFPLGKHDDVIDAFSMQLQIAAHWFSEARVKQMRDAERKVLVRAGVLQEDEDVEAHWQSIAGRWGGSTEVALG